MRGFCSMRSQIVTGPLDLHLIHLAISFEIVSTVVEIIDAVRRLDEKQKMSFLPNSPRSISTTRGTVKSTRTREQDGLIFFGRKRSGT